MEDDPITDYEFTEELPGDLDEHFSDDDAEDEEPELTIIQEALGHIPKSFEEYFKEALNNNESDEDTAPHCWRRVLKDIFHLMDTVYIKKAHGYYYEFYQLFRDAIFIYNADDIAKVDAVLQRQGTSVHRLRTYKRGRAFLRRRIRNIVPAPEIVYQRVLLVYNEFKEKKDAKTGQLLFNNTACRQMSTVLQQIRDGYASDPPGFHTHVDMGTDSDGLTLWHCIRGTNSVEATVHQYVSRQFGCKTKSGELGDILLAAFRHKRNYKMAVKYEQVTDVGHTRLAMVDKSARMYESLTSESYLACDVNDVRRPWRRPEDYVPTDEQFGIVSLVHAYNQADLDLTIANIARLNQEAAANGEKPIRPQPSHEYIAQRQGLPAMMRDFIGSKEWAMYREVVSVVDREIANKAADPNKTRLQLLMTTWCGRVDGVKYFLKLPPHFESAEEKLKVQYDKFRTMAETHQDVMDLHDELLNKTMAAEVTAEFNAAAKVRDAALASQAADHVVTEPTVSEKEMHYLPPEPQANTTYLQRPVVLEEEVIAQRSRTYRPALASRTVNVGNFQQPPPRFPAACRNVPPTYLPYPRVMPNLASMQICTTTAEQSNNTRPILNPMRPAIATHTRRKRKMCVCKDEKCNGAYLKNKPCQQQD